MLLHFVNFFLILFRGSSFFAIKKEERAWNSFYVSAETANARALQNTCSQNVSKLPENTCVSISLLTKLQAAGDLHLY